MPDSRAVVTWTEFQVPAVTGSRMARVGWVEMEAPNAPSRAVIAWIEMEVPSDPSESGTTFSAELDNASEAVAGLAAVAYPPIDPYLHALSVALKKIAKQGEPLTVFPTGTTGKLAKFTNAARLGDSIISESASAALVSGTLTVSGDQTVHGKLIASVGLSRAELFASGGSGTDPTLSFITTSALRAIIGAAAAAGDLVVGSAAGDLVIRTQGGSVRVTVNSGVSTGLLVTTAGIDHPGVHKIAGVQVLGTRKTGYVAMTGALNRGTVYATSTITLIQLAERVKALQDDLMSHGAIGT